eukprot:snap_masked-scaffold_15-processed-gene-10.11-mRNA-1 protein AED:1.00 eAED:1.00 QI:0/0/0/0/1/1/2/0/492
MSSQPNDITEFDLLEQSSLTDLIQSKRNTASKTSESSGPKEAFERESTLGLNDSFDSEDEGVENTENSKSYGMSAMEAWNAFTTSARTVGRRSIKRTQKKKGYVTEAAYLDCSHKLLTFPAESSVLTEKYKFQPKKYVDKFSSSKRPRVLAKRNEDGKYFLMSIFDGKSKTKSKEEIIRIQQQNVQTEFGLQAMCQHPNLCKLEETMFDYKLNYYVFVEYSKTAINLKEILFDPIKYKKYQDTIHRKNFFKLRQNGTGNVDLKIRHTAKETSKFAAHTHLADFIDSDFKRNCKVWPEEVILYVLKCVLSALNFLHRIHIVQRDLRASNILVDVEGNVKIASLKYSKLLTYENDTTNEAIGNILYMAPEVMRKFNYNESADIWSFGVFMLEVSQGKVPYENSTLKEFEIMKQVIKSPSPTLSTKRPFLWSPDFKALLRHCLHHNSSVRRTSSRLIRDKVFLKAVDKKRFSFFMDNFEKSLYSVHAAERLKYTF